MPLRILFFGTPRFAVPTLEALVASTHTVVGVVTQPDRRRGRGQKITMEAVKRTARHHGLPVLQPQRLKDDALATDLASLEPDLGVVAAYGRLLPDVLLTLPRLGMINVHASLLPRWRGAAPIQRAILAGDRKTGVTIMRVIQELDAGAIMAQVSTPIGAAENSAQLEGRLSVLGAALLVETVDRIAEGSSVETPQDDARATYAARLDRADSQIDWARPARTVHDRIRGLHPWPGAAGMLGGQRVTLLRSEISREDDTGRPPGTLIAAGDTLDVATKPGAIRVLELRAAGRAAASAAAFLRGRRLAAGDHFDPLPLSAS